MRKKLISFTLCVAMTCLFGCGGSKIPDGMSEDTYNIGVKALEIMDKYNNADITSDEADERLDALHDKIKSLEFEDGSDESTQNTLVSTSISYFQYLIGPLGDGFNVDGDPYTSADDLRELLELD